MTKTLKLTVAFLGFALLFGTSCKKYEEGPGISLASKKARVANTWTIEKYMVDGIDYTSTLAGIELEVTFEKDGKYSAKSTFLGSTDTETGTWEFGDKKETIKTIVAGVTEESTITKLKKNELWTKDVEDGETTEIHFKTK